MSVALHGIYRTDEVSYPGLPEIPRKRRRRGGEIRVDQFSKMKLWRADDYIARPRHTDDNFHRI